MSQDQVAIAPMKKETPTVAVQRDGKQTWWQSLPPKQRNIINGLAIALGISLVAAVAIYFGISVVRKQVSKAEENKSLGTSKHATWAKQIKNSFENNGWWGTDEVLLRNTLREIPSKEDFKKVSISYKKLFKGRSMVQDMTGELKTTEYNEMLAIINAKPEKAKDAKKGVAFYDPHGWAKRINAAVSYAWIGLMWGTDEDAITAVFLEFPSQQAYYDTASVYKDMYGVSLMTDLKGDLSSYYINKYQNMVKGKPKK